MWGLKTCEIKELGTEKFLKLNGRTLGCSKEADHFRRDAESFSKGTYVVVGHGKATGLPA